MSESSAPAPRVFTYEPVAACVCGTALPGPTAVRRAHAWGAVEFRRCVACGAYTQSPRVDRASLADWYDSVEYAGGGGGKGGFYDDYLADEALRGAEATARMARDLARLVPRGANLLEIGCATGSFLAAARAAGYAVRGCDLSARFAAVARDLHGLDVAVGDYLDLPKPAGAFDAIVALGTISNLPDLPRALAKMRRKLAPGGLLYFNFPAADSFVARFYGASFWMFAPSAAAFLTVQAVRRALANAGFRVESMRSDRQRPSFGKLASLARMAALARIVEKTGLSRRALPFPVPIPGVRVVWARKIA